MRVMRHSNVCHDSFIYLCHDSFTHVCHDSFVCFEHRVDVRPCVGGKHICVPELMRTCDLTHSYMCAIKHANVCHDSFICVCHDSFICLDHLVDVEPCQR